MKFGGGFAASNKIESKHKYFITSHIKCHLKSALIVIETIL